MTTTPGTGVRARARAALVAEITAAARRQLAVDGASGLSLRAIARELGMVSSAIYRYFPSRDDLLTALIIEAYDSIGAAAEAADAAVADRDDVRGRWRAVARAVRSWAKANPHEYALVYGSPVPGYRAPQDTVGPATRVSLTLAAILRDARRGAPPRDDASAVFSAEVLGALGEPDDALAVRALTAWSSLFGLVSFELFGQLVGAVDDTDAFFARAVDELAAFSGVS